jgi:hypothetical protein
MTRTVEDGNMKQVTLSNGGRFYEWKDEHYKSVTTILSSVLHKDFLAPWAAKRTAEFAIDNLPAIQPLIDAGDREAAIALVKGAYRRTSGNAADRGTAVHQAAEDIAAGKPVKLNDYLPEVQPFVKAFQKFVKEHDPQWINVETQVASRVGWYAGTCDLRVALKGQPVTIDIKTSKVAPTPEHKLQLAAYNHAEFCVINGEEHPWMPTTWGAVLQLQPNEGYRLHNVDVSLETANIFLAVKEIYDWLHT